jgi:NAD(P)-dependent dehydrogenase (short-subunit alcohol dehydrogenase family)
MDLSTAVAVVTGANRGLGRHIAGQLLERGATVYAGVRRPDSLDLPGAIPLRLDITDPDAVAEAARTASGATLLVNNAGVATYANALSGDLADVRLEMETHYFGTLAVSRAFAPVIEANGGGAILNVLSVLSWVHYPELGAYSAAKAAGWALTNVLREDLAPRGVKVSALHVGYMDTDMAAHAPADQKSDPAVIAAAALDGLAAGAPEILADAAARRIREGLGAPLPA